MYLGLDTVRAGMEVLVKMDKIPGAFLGTWGEFDEVKDFYWNRLLDAIVCKL